MISIKISYYIVNEMIWISILTFARIQEMGTYLTGYCQFNLKKIYYLAILLLFLMLSGCQIATQEEIAQLPTLSITYSPSDFPLETPTTSGVNPSSTLTPKSTATPIQPSPSKIVLTPLPTLLPAPTMVNEAVLYGMDIDRENQIYALQPDGTSRFIIKGRMPLGQSLSPDKTKLIVNANDLPSLDDSPDEVFIYDLEAEEILPLNLLYAPSRVFWSEDGTLFLYIARYDDGIPDQLVSYDVFAGTNQVLIEMERIVGTAGWSIDRETIAFIAEVDGQYDLFTVNSKNLEQERLTDDDDIETRIIWSPVASHLLVGTAMSEEVAFEAWPWGVEKLSLLDVDSHNTLWFADKNLMAEAISWSPDGTQIAFWAPGGQLCIQNIETMIEVCPLAKSPPYNDYGVSSSTQPAWSSDGNWLAFRAYNGTCTMIHFVELETNFVVPGDLGCDVTIFIPLASRIHWLPTDFLKQPE